MSVRPTSFRRWAWLALALVATGALFILQSFFYEVPILMYHQVGEVPEDSSVHVSQDTFERQMEFLKVHRFRVISLSQLVDEIKNGKKIPAKTVCITFDDGRVDNFRFAFPILKKMAFPATIFMITDNVGREGWLSEEDLRILDESEVTIGSHTAHHAFLPDHDPAEVEKELKESKAALEKILGHSVTLFSYPAGGTTAAIRQQVIDAGYDGAVTTNYGNQPHDPYQLHRIKVSESSRNLFNFWVKVSGFYHIGKKRVEAKARSVDAYES